MKIKNRTSQLESKIDRLEVSVNEIREVAKENQSTLQDLMEVMNNFATQVQTEFVEIKGRLTDVEIRLSKVSATMVTKDYLDDKLGDLHGDLVLLMRKEDTKKK